jgi:hypothetical protein
MTHITWKKSFQIVVGGVSTGIVLGTLNQTTLRNALATSGAGSAVLAVASAEFLGF